MKRSRLDPLLDLSPVEILGALLVVLGILCLLALTCTGCGGAPFGTGLLGDSGAPALAPDAGSPEALVQIPAREAGVGMIVPLEASPASDGGPARDAGADRVEKEFAPEAAASPDAGPEPVPEAGPPPPDPACLRCSVTCGSSQLSYTCAGGPFSCGHSPYVAGDLSCSSPGACVVSGPCGLPGNPACWGGTVVYERGVSCP